MEASSADDNQATSSCGVYPDLQVAPKACHKDMVRVVVLDDLIVSKPLNDRWRLGTNWAGDVVSSTGPDIGTSTTILVGDLRFDCTQSNTANQTHLKL